MSRWVIAGVSGVGKTTIGQALAERLGYPFLDADDFHPAENLQKMKSGIPLDDKDRMPWLDRLGAEISQHEDLVVACSALKKVYRDRLISRATGIQFVILTAPRRDLEQRLSSRDHFMPPSLLDSQLADLEIGEDIRIVENVGETGDVVEFIINSSNSAF